MENLIKTEIELSGARVVNANNTIIGFQFIPPYPPTLSRYILGDDFFNLNSTTIAHLFNIVSNGNSTITSYGFVASENPSPTILDDVYEISTSETIGLITGEYIDTNLSLRLNKTYYIRPYATNGIGTVYGNERILLTGSKGQSLSNNTLYSTETINNQLWTKFNWASAYLDNITTVEHYYPNFSISSGDNSFGYLYKWSDSQNIAPTGWHLPSDNEYLSLIASLGGSMLAGGKLKETGTTNWESPNTGAINNSLFYGRGAGWKNNGYGQGGFLSQGYYITSSRYGLDNARSLAIFNNSTISTCNTVTPDEWFCSVRLVKNLYAPPIAITYDATSITETTSILNGNVNPLGYSTVVSFEYGLTNSYGSEIVANESPVTGSVLNSITANLTGLTNGTVYHFRVKAVNINGTSYGSDFEFTTVLHIDLPTVSTTTITSITATTATGGGNVTSDGGGTITARGACWSTSSNPTILNSKTVDSGTTGSYVSSLTSLNELTTYYVRAYATNSVGTSYGSEVTFDTIAAATTPVISAWNYNDGDDFYNENQYYVNHKFKIESNGGSPITSYGFAINTSQNPTINNNYRQVGTDDYIGEISDSYKYDQSFNLVLVRYSTYYIRPYVSNSVGTTYGNERILIVGGDNLGGNATLYSTQVIGTQLWTKFNWTASKYSGGNLDIKSPYGDSGNLGAYGGLYNWADANLLAPTGWHLSSIAECDTLSTYLGGNNVSGGKLKDIGDTYWNSGNTGATNSALFYSRGAGWVSTNGTTYNDFLATQYLWTTTLDSGVNYFRFKQSSNAITSATAFSGNKDNYYSVRLIKD